MISDFKILFTESEIKSKIKSLASEINNYYGEEEVVVVSLLRGSFIFVADLVRELNMKVNIDFMTTSSYGNETSSSGKVELVHDLRTDIEGKNVLVVDDILDSARTMSFVLNIIKNKNPKTLKSCVLLDKPSRRTEKLDADFKGFIIDDLFIVGYGLNYGDYYRNLADIYVLNK